MKWLAIILVVALLALQYRLWMGEGSIASVVSLNREIAKQKEENARLRERNRLLAAEVDALKQGKDAIEERARNDMGMIKEGETFFMIVDETDKDTKKNKK
ncbi:cell division protein FtsB [Saccharophagus degradans]|uniref:Cell division protein FtsB n=2 Tax=Saccharophagus degradans TaxID=86304 RepID=FTSB_SACD2|nr:cell division protein FtsB [Saccharophagus degradans]Q21LC1.1 RecName: Full=Cell division protein FtsB [Saccharophagus degradans 2-40]ABD80508.1 cell division protein FtsB [Saccharophagus degradans 2-40]MDO6422956.1 cell division protein FtsB [Saccharophagus degradans]MDO6607101.1 cell division protein FtsB [Saccharophagus degradans]